MTLLQLKIFKCALHRTK